MFLCDVNFFTSTVVIFLFLCCRVLVMLALHIYFFALFGMLLFPSGKVRASLKKLESLGIDIDPSMLNLEIQLKLSS